MFSPNSQKPIVATEAKEGDPDDELPVYLAEHLDSSDVEIVSHKRRSSIFRRRSSVLVLSDSSDESPVKKSTEHCANGKNS